MSVTIRTIVDEALGVISEVGGAGTETYEEDRMFQDAIRGFNMVFKKTFWPQYCNWFQLELDGTLGIVKTDDLQNVLEFEDFYGAYRDGERRALPRLSRKQNPFSLITGSQARYWDYLNFRNQYYTKRRLQFYPKESIGFVNILAREYPVGPNQIDVWKAWDWSDTPMEIDKDLLVYATSYAALSRDGLNSEAAADAREMMEQRYRDLRSALSSQPIEIAGDSDTIPMDHDAFQIFRLDKSVLGQ